MSHANQIARLSRDSSGNIRPSCGNVVRLRPLGWGDFKHKLAQHGVIASPTDEVPDAWKMVFVLTFRK